MAPSLIEIEIDAHIGQSKGNVMPKQSSGVYGFAIAIALCLCAWWSLNIIRFHYHNHLQRNVLADPQGIATSHAQDRDGMRLEPLQSCHASSGHSGSGVVH